MNSQTRTLDAITGLRWLAAFLVFIHHVGGKFGLPKASVPLGSLAVSFFFVLSGFILTYVYKGRLQPGTRSVGRFYFTRWARIWPLHIVCLGICLLVLTPSSRFADAPETVWQLVVNALLLQSWVPNDAWVFGFNGVSWSISTELFFYLCFPILLLGRPGRFWIKFVVVWTVVLGLLVAMGQLESLPAFAAVDFARFGHVNPLIRLAEFATGMAVGHLYLLHPSTRLTRSRWWDTLIEIGAVAAVCSWYPLMRGTGILHGGDTAWIGSQSLSSWLRVASPVLPYVVTIFVFSRSRGWLTRALSSRPLVFLGEVSFAFYMVHMMVIQYALRNWYLETVTPGWLIAGCAACISLGLSMALFKLVEMPAKSTLLALYDGRWKSASSALPSAAAQFLASPLVWLTVLLVGIPSAVGMTYSRWPESVRVALAPGLDSQVQVARNLSEPVSFGDRIELIDCQWDARPRGVELKLIWKKLGPLEHRRYIHLCGDDGKPVGFGPRNDDLFARMPINKMFVETMFFSSEQLARARFVGVGFHLPGKGMLVVDAAQTTLNGRRWTLVERDEIDHLLARQARRFSQTARIKDRNDKRSIER